MNDNSIITMEKYKEEMVQLPIGRGGGIENPRHPVVR